jgi:hypothetical protein
LIKSDSLMPAMRAHLDRLRRLLDVHERMMQMQR